MNKAPEVLLVGMPNSGKSTLFNRISKQRSAITSEEAHTTRDTNTAIVSANSIIFELVDSAGFTIEKDDIRLSAMELMNSRLDSASLVIMVVDGTTPVTQEDIRLAKSLHKSGKELILAINKADQGKLLAPTESFAKLGIQNIFSISAHQGDGCDDLLDAITGLLPSSSARKTTDAIAVAILGRPNVGKSSLLNAFAEKTLAIESPTAHTTRDINRYQLSFFKRAIEIVDTAGLRRPGKVGKHSDIEFYSSLRTKRAIEEADVCMVLLDATEQLTAQDERIIGAVKDSNKACIIVVNKWDLVEKDSHTMAEYSGLLRSHLQYIYWAPLIFVSAKERQNVENLKKIICEVYDRGELKISTPILNRFIADANAVNPPSAIKTHKPKVNYATQTGSRPLEITIFCTHPKLMHWSYTRYLQNKLREKYDLNGVPVVIKYRSKYKDQ